MYKCIKLRYVKVLKCLNKWTYVHVYRQKSVPLQRSKTHETMNIKNMEDVVAALQVLAHNSGLSAREVARRAGVSPQTVINGAATGYITLSVLLRILEAYGATMKIAARSID